VDFFGKFEQIKETGFGRENQLSLFSHLAQWDRLEPVAFCFWAKFRQLATKKRKTQCDLYKGFFLKTFKKLAIFLKKKEIIRQI
jgi:hypothetical protein